MKYYFLFISIFFSSALETFAQDHLEPDTSDFAHPSSYMNKNRIVFIDAFDDEVILRALVLRSFQNEYVIGISIKDEHAEVFLLEASSSVWASDNLENCRFEIKSYEVSREKVPPNLLERLKDLEANAVDYRTIKAIRRAKPIPREIAEEIRLVWEAMLVDAKHPKKVPERRRTDGVTYHYSAFIKDRGEISGHIYQPKSGTKLGELATITLVLGDYARGKAELSEVKTKLVQAQKSINQ